ncbi:hypothetical protein, partial [Umezakia ovalisporum]|uniref:hypothetical protein n=1 Tax=Umezakia ovalisporum TaxID=75695 RepID=UPI0039C6D958
MALLSWSANAQRVLKHTLIPRGGGGSSILVCKITDYQLLVDCTNGAFNHNFVFINANGDIIQSQIKSLAATNIIRVNDEGFFLALNLNDGLGAITGIVFDSLGAPVTSFRHVVGDPLTRGQLYYLDSYNDSADNVVLHLYSVEGFMARDRRIYHITINTMGQLVKVKDYGIASPLTFFGAVEKGSKLLVKDGKLWGFTTLTEEGVIGWGIDT